MGKDELALVMSGGGARAAYQVGFLRCLAHYYPDLHIPILTGVSAGAINAAYLASHSEIFLDKAELLIKLWEGLTTDHIFRVDPLSIAANVLRWGIRLLMGRASYAVRARSLLSTQPLQSLLEHVLHPMDGKIPGIEHNLARGDLKAVAITASNYSTGQSITWGKADRSRTGSGPIARVFPAISAWTISWPRPRCPYFFRRCRLIIAGMAMAAFV